MVGSSSPLASDSDGKKYFGPDTQGWCAATAGPFPPRLTLPDLQDSAVTLAAALPAGFTDAGAAGLGLPAFGDPQRARYLW